MKHSELYYTKSLENEQFCHYIQGAVIWEILVVQFLRDDWLLVKVQQSKTQTLSAQSMITTKYLLLHVVKYSYIRGGILTKIEDFTTRTIVFQVYRSITGMLTVKTFCTAVYKRNLELVEYLYRSKYPSHNCVITCIQTAVKQHSSEHK